VVDAARGAGAGAAVVDVAVESMATTRTRCDSIGTISKCTSSIDTGSRRHNRRRKLYDTRHENKTSMSTKIHMNGMGTLGGGVAGGGEAETDGVPVGG
jgi:hypothetical protein